LTRSRLPVYAVVQSAEYARRAYDVRGCGFAQRLSQDVFKVQLRNRRILRFTHFL